MVTRLQLFKYLGLYSLCLKNIIKVLKDIELLLNLAKLYLLDRLHLVFTKLIFKSFVDILNIG